MPVCVLLKSLCMGAFLILQVHVCGKFSKHIPKWKKCRIVLISGCAFQIERIKLNYNLVFFMFIPFNNCLHGFGYFRLSADKCEYQKIFSLLLLLLLSVVRFIFYSDYFHLNVKLNLTPLHLKNNREHTDI